MTENTRWLCIALLFIAIIVQACGMKGDLYLPQTSIDTQPDERQNDQTKKKSKTTQPRE